MSIRTSPWPAGVPCWADLATTDVEAAKSFYGAVLDWDFDDTGSEYGGYAIAHRRGAVAAGIGPQQGIAPTMWMLYLASDDADKTAAGIAEHGGTVVLTPGDVGTMGRMLIAADPSGAAFGVWEAKTHIGAGLVNEPGGLTWCDLRSTDPDSTRDFYTRIFGYRTEKLAAAGPDYTTFALPEEESPLGGMGGMMGLQGMPSHWIVYFAVADVPAALDAAENAGGSVLLRDFDTPYGRMAAVIDPAGAAFWVIETDGQDQPDRSG